MIKKGGPSSGTPLPEWSVSDDGAGLLSGTLKVFIDGNAGLTSKGTASSKGFGADGKSVNANGGFGPAKSAADGIPATGSRHPFDGRLICYGTSTSFNSMGYGYVEAQYIGLLQDPAGVEWELSATTSDEAIETHPKFLGAEGNTEYEVEGTPTSGSTLGGGEGGIANPTPTGRIRTEFGTITKKGINPQTKGPYWDLSNVYVDGPTQAFKGFRASEFNIENRFIGVESYKVPVATLRVSFTTMSADNFNWAVNGIGTIVSQIPSFLNRTIAGSPADTSGSGSSPVSNDVNSAVGNVGADAMSGADKSGWRKLLITNASVAFAGGLYKVSVEFARSGIYGWNPRIYNAMDDRSLGNAGAASSNK
jgi:hypothetical protein